MSSHSTRAVVAVVIGLVFILATPAARADVFWTTDPANTSGIQPGDGCWDTDNYWATDSSGNGATMWVGGFNANFYADSNPTSTVTITNSVSAGSVVSFNGSGYTVTGGLLNLRRRHHQHQPERHHQLGHRRLGRPDQGRRRHAHFGWR